MPSRSSKHRAPEMHAAGFPINTILTSILIATGVAACSPALPSTPEPTVRVIVRFKPGVPDPLDPAFLTRLADLSRVTHIDPIRPMSGNAYVLQVTCVDPQAAQPAVDPCASAVARLSRSDAVLGIEVDRREKLQ